MMSFLLTDISSTMTRCWTFISNDHYPLSELKMAAVRPRLSRIMIKSAFVVSFVPGAVSVAVVQSVPGAAVMVRSVPGAVVQSVRDLVVRSVPMAVVRSVPGTVIRSVPGAVIRSVPGTVVRSVPGSVVRSVPGAVAVPGAVVVARIARSADLRPPCNFPRLPFQPFQSPQ